MNTTTGKQSVCFEFDKPWSFGANALLSEHDLVFLCRMLECPNCRLRQVYHSLAARELSASDALTCRPLRARHHFHRMARLIKAVLIASKRQKVLYRSGSRFLNSISGQAVTCGFIRLRRQCIRRWICSDHGTDLFHYLFYAADDAVQDRNIQQVRASQPSAWTKTVFPKGQTEFFDRGLSKFERASSRSSFRSSFSSPNFISTDLISPSCGFMLILGSAQPSGGSSNSDLEDANRRWSEAYSDDVLAKPVEKKHKTVHFPKFTPVTGVCHMITYDTANRLLRKDRTWECQFLDRLREGQSLSDEEDGDDDHEDHPPPPPSTQPEAQVCISTICTVSSSESAAGEAPPKKRRRRKRRKRCSRENKAANTELSPLPQFLTVDLWQHGAAPSFHLDLSYLDTVCALLSSRLYASPPPTPPSPSPVLSNYFRVATTVSPEN